MSSVPHLPLTDSDPASVPNASPMPITPSFSAASTVSTPGLDFPGAYPRTPKDFPHTTSNATSNLLNDNATPSPDTESSGLAGRGAGGGGLGEAFYNATVTASHYLPPRIVEYFPGGSAIVDANNADADAEHNHNMLRDARGIPIHYDDSASATRPDKFESDSIANVSTVAQDGSAGATPTKEKTLPLTESETHLVENDETVPPTSSPTHTSNENPVPVPINLTARTHPLAGDGTQWKGVPLDESYQSDVVDHALEDTTTSSTAVNADIPTPSIPSLSSQSIDKSLPRVPQIPATTSGIQSQTDSTMANTGHSTPSVPIKSPADTNSNFVASPSSFAHKSDINNSSVQSRSTETTGSNSLSAPPSAFVSTSPSAFDSPSKNTASQFKTSSSNHEKDASASSAASSSGSANSAGDPTRHKTKLLTKLRGEAKIFSGKLSGKEEKVEEGRRIVRGEL